MHYDCLAATFIGHWIRSIKYIAAILIVSSSAFPAEADWECTPGTNGTKIYSPEYIQGSINYKGHDKSFQRKITLYIAKRLNINNQLVQCDEMNNCSFAHNFYSSLKVDEEDIPKDRTAMTICTSIASSCITGFCSKYETFRRLVFDWNGGFVDFMLDTSKPSRNRIKEDRMLEVNIPLTERIIDVWPRRVGISQTESINFSYTALRKE